MIYFESILCGLHVLVDENIITERERERVCGREGGRGRVDGENRYDIMIADITGSSLPS